MERKWVQEARGGWAPAAIFACIRLELALEAREQASRLLPLARRAATALLSTTAPRAAARPPHRLSQHVLHHEAKLSRLFPLRVTTASPRTRLCGKRRCEPVQPWTVQIQGLRTKHRWPQYRRWRADLQCSDCRLDGVRAWARADQPTPTRAHSHTRLTELPGTP